MSQTIKEYTVRMLEPEETFKAIPLALKFQEDAGSKPRERQQEHWLAHWKLVAENEMGGILVLEKNDEPVGLLCVQLGLSPLDGCPQMTEAMWYVRKEDRGQGLSLLDAAEDLAQTVGCERIHIAHLANREGRVLSRLYKRRGFAPSETFYVKEL